MKAYTIILFIVLSLISFSAVSQDYIKGDVVYSIQFSMNLANEELDYSIAEIINRTSKDEVILVGINGNKVIHKIYSKTNGDGSDAVLVKYKAKNEKSDCVITILEQDEAPFRAITYATQNPGYTNIALAFKVSKIKRY